MKSDAHINERRYMKMKTINLLLGLVLIASLFAMPFVMAEDETLVETNETPEDMVIAPAPEVELEDTTSVDEETIAEINDGFNESVSGMRIGWERAKLAFTFNNEKKAMQELKLAKLRLIQARVAAKNGNEKAMEKALEAHERVIERVKTRVNAIDGASDNESARLAAAKLVGLERAIEVHEARISKLGEILASENLTDAQRERIEANLEKVQANAEKLKELEADKKEKLKTKMRAVANMTEEEVESAIEEIEDAQNLPAVRNLVSQVREQHRERIAERVEMRQKIWNNLSEETREEIRETVRSEVQQRLNSEDDAEDESENETSDSGNGESGSSGSGSGNKSE